MTGTDSEVEAAEAQAIEAEALANTLEDAIRSGDESVTHEELTSQRSLVGFLRLQVEGARTKAAARRVEARAKAIRDIKTEVLRIAPESGEHLVAALHEVDAAAEEFYRLAQAHDEQLRTWRTQLEAVGVTAGNREEGIGLNGINILLVDGMELPLVDGGRHLNKLFTGQADPYGTLVPSGDDRKAATYSVLRAIGKAN